MSIEEIAEALRQELAVVLNQPPVELALERPLHEIGVDSIAFVELMVFIEKRFGLSLLEARLERKDIESLQAIAATVERLQAAP
jgi:acyl carrier protein